MNRVVWYGIISHYVLPLAMGKSILSLKKKFMFPMTRAVMTTITTARMALTEASVLSDVIQIVQHQQKYVALNQVVAYPTSTTTPTYQYVVKKRSLGVAADILRRGMESLSVSSTDREREFHRAIAFLRQRWRLKRVGSGIVVGDLSYRSGSVLYEKWEWHCLVKGDVSFSGHGMFVFR